MRKTLEKDRFKVKKVKIISETKLKKSDRNV